METTKQEIRNYFFGNIFPFEDEIEFKIRGEKADLFEAIELCVDHITTSQKQTIERLREIVGVILKRCEENRNHIEVWGNYHLLKEAEKLVTTTEPKTEDELMEEKTDRNANIISSFMEHCKQNGFTIPDSWFESYFNA